MQYNMLYHKIILLSFIELLYRVFTLTSQKISKNYHDWEKMKKEKVL